MVDTGRKIDQGFADATKRPIFGLVATLEFSCSLCITLLHPVMESIFPWYAWDFPFLILTDGFTGMGCEMYMADFAIYF